MKIRTKILVSFILLLTAVSAAAQFTIDGKRPVLDNRTGKLLMTLPESVFGGPYSAQVAMDDTVAWVMISGKQIRTPGEILLPKVSGDTIYKVYYSTHGHIQQIQMRFTFLPILCMTGDLDTVYQTVPVQVTLPEGDSTQEYRARVKWAGASTALKWIKKHSFHLKFVDENGEKTDVSFFGLRDDNHWRLDAGTMDMMRIRNKVAHSLWKDFKNKPYYADRQPKARTYTRGDNVEVFINGDYMGFFDLTEFLDRKQMKLKKYDTEANEFHGMLWKSKDDTQQTLFITNARCDETRDYWAGFSLAYPDIDEVCPTDYSVLRNAVDFVAKSFNPEFRAHAAEYFDVPIFEDYFVFIQTLFAMDNTSINMVYGCYDSAEDKKLTLAVWDLNATCGAHWRNQDGFYRAPEIQPENDMDSIRTDWSRLPINRLLRRMRELPDFRWHTINRYWQLRETVLNPDSLVARYTAVYDRLGNAGALIRETERWSGCEDFAFRRLDFNDEYNYLCDWIRRRIAYLDTHVFACVRGDVNGDGIADANDISLLINYLLSAKQDMVAINVINADANGDNKIDPADLSAMINLLLHQ